MHTHVHAQTHRYVNVTGMSAETHLCECLSLFSIEMDVHKTNQCCVYEGLYVEFDN